MSKKAINLEDLSDDEKIMSSLTSCISLLEAEVKAVQDFKKSLDSKISGCLDNYFDKRMRGGNRTGLGISTQVRDNTPDPPDGEGAVR